MEEEIAFPRGGRTPSETIKKRNLSKEEGERESNASSRKEKRKRTNSDDFLFGTKLSQDKTKKSQKKIKTSTSSRGKTKTSESTQTRTEMSSAGVLSVSSSVVPMGGGAVLQPTTAKAALIEAISFQKLAKGTKLLGIVREVSSDYALVSLPNMLTGYIRRDEKITIGVDKMISVGMVLSVFVLKATQETVTQPSSGNHRSKDTVVKKRIELSIYPNHVNDGWSLDTLYEGMTLRGRIKSVEDHGCLVDIGVAGIGGNSCFLKFDNIEGGYTLMLDDDHEAEDDDDAVMEEYEPSTKFVINKGRLYDFTVKSIPSKSDRTSSTSIIQLSLETNTTLSKRITEPKMPSKSSSFSLRTLSPGMLVSGTVEHHARNGLCVAFLGNLFRGAIEMAHLGGYFSDSVSSLIQRFGKESSTSKTDCWWKEVFAGKLNVVLARIIAVDPATKIIRLSLLPHILKLSSPSLVNQPVVGAVYEGARVVRLDPGVGALIALPSSAANTGKSDSKSIINRLSDEPNDENNTRTHSKLLSNPIYKVASTVQCAYLHISKASDNIDDSTGTSRTSESFFNKRFAPGSAVSKLRILSNLNLLDNVTSCGTADSIISSVALSYQDLKPGAIYKSVPILAHLKGGSLLVQLGAAGVTGIVPSHHIFDQVEYTISVVSTNKTNNHRNKQRMEKFKVGNKIDIRCLFVDAVQKKCMLTAKPSLLNSDVDDPIDNYSSIEKGRIATGFISRVSELGVNVTFYNNVFGSISARRLAEEKGIENPMNDYKFGDVIKVRVLKCVPSQRNIRSAHDAEESGSFYLELSLNLQPSDDAHIDISDNASVCLLPSGSTFPANTIKVVELCDSPPEVARKNGIDGITPPGYAIVSIRNKDVANLNQQTGKKTFHCKLPYEHLIDTIPPDASSSADFLNNLARTRLVIGQRVPHESIVISYDNSIKMNILSLKPKLVETAKNPSRSPKIILPNLNTSLYMGAYLCGYCARLDSRYGAFIKFLDNVTGLIPKVKGGLDIGLYNSVLCRVLAVDLVSGKAPKILLKPVSSTEERDFVSDRKISSTVTVKPGDCIGDVRVDNINFARAAVTLIDPKYGQSRIKARIHMTMADPFSEIKNIEMPLKRAIKDDVKAEDIVRSQIITKYHPFYKWKIGSIIKNVKCVLSSVRDDITYVELTNTSRSLCKMPIVHRELELDTSVLFIENVNDLQPGTKVRCTITNVSKSNRGIWTQICPGINGFLSGLEISDDIRVLNGLSNYFKIGGRVIAWVVSRKDGGLDQAKDVVYLSLRDCGLRRKPSSGNLTVGRINRVAFVQRPPALMLELPGGHLARCDVTELQDYEKWVNMPLGRSLAPEQSKSRTNGYVKTVNYNSVQLNGTHEDSVLDTFHDDESVEAPNGGDYSHGKYVRCRVISDCLDVSLRPSRIEGQLEDDKLPLINDIVQAFVVSTTKKGCFLRLSQHVEGRVLLKDLSDGFIHDPPSVFPPGRLVVGRIQAVHDKINSNKTSKFGSSVLREVDLNMRESAILEDENRLTFDGIKEGQKYQGIITRIESFGVFVRFDHSDISGLAHLSECSDDYIKNLQGLYDPGDLVKALVLKVDGKLKRVSLSLKASHFEEDDDMNVSIDDSNDEESVALDSTSQSDLDSIAQSMPDDDLDSDDDNYVSRLSEHAKGDLLDEDDASDEEKDEENSLESEDETSEQSDFATENVTMETDVGFDWGNQDTESRKAIDVSEDETENDESDEDSDSNHSDKNIRSRKKGSAKQEEREVSSKEFRIASGAADENPETVSDFERLLACNPDSSEIWIRYMAFHLSLADIDSARHIANRALDRIEFRREGEKLNVWTALLTLELKFGTTDSFQSTLERASQQNNPKQIYLRACELLERESDELRKRHNNESKEYLSIVSRTDDMFLKMVKKFKTKKTVWIAYNKYLLMSGRQNEAQDILKRAMSSLPSYKHIETTSKFAQTEYEHGSSERARTMFEAILEKYPKRLDILFVFIDKEVKYGDAGSFRKIFERSMTYRMGDQKLRYSDKQMKSLFKKWYKLEDLYGDEITRLHVKNEARRYVENSTKTDN